MIRRLYILLLSLFVVVVCLTSCTKDNGLELDQPQQQDIEYTYLHCGFGPRTYAPTIYTSEKRLFSVAFFIETGDGAFHKYMSHRSSSDPIGQGIKGDFEEVTMSENNHNYEGVTIKMENLAYGICRIAVVGNYDTERGVGIEDKLVAVTSMNDLLNLKLDTPQAGVKVNLLVYDYQVIDINKALASGVQFTMKRAAARITMPFVFSSGGKTLSLSTPISKGLAECSMLVYNPKSATYIIDPQLDDNISLAEATAKVNAIPQMERVDPIAFTPATDKFEFYTYEMAGGDPVNMEVYVILKVRETTSDPWKEQIHAVMSYQNVEGKTILHRNSAYSVDNPYNVDVDTDGWDKGGIWNIFK